MQVFSGIGAELTLLAGSLLMGAAMFAAYDALRILRRIFPHGIIWVSVEDFFYWIAAAGWFFLRICKENDGIIRFYILLAVALGAMLYHGLFGRHLIRCADRFIAGVKKRLKKIRKAATMRLENLQGSRKKNER